MRVGQDVTFEVAYLRGEILTACIGICTDGGDLEPAVVRLKTRGRPWQRFFLDVSFAVWEDDVPDEDDSFRAVDYAAMFDIDGATILGAHAVEHCGSSRIVLKLSTGILTLAPRATGLDTGAHLAFVPST